MPTINVGYQSNGKKELKMKALTSDGMTLEAHSYVNIFSPALQITPLSSTENSNAPTPTTQTLSTTWNGISVTAHVAYYLRNGTLRKPFIVVEGFDPWELNEITGSTTDEQNIELGSITYKDFADSIYYNSKDEITPDALRNGYDLVYIDWYNSTEDIRANAELLIEIIREINRKKAEAGSSEKNVLMGQSMGGLIARYALKTMENEGESHEVSTYISHDSPHLGANVPVGAFYFVNQLFSLSNGYSEAVSLLYNDLSGIEETTIYNIMNSTAARQMMCNYLSPAV